MIEKKAIVQLFKLAEKHQDIGIVSPKIYFAPGFEYHKKIWSNKFQKLFAIVQWWTYPDLREISAKQLTEINFDGYAIWGLAVWEPNEKMYEMIEVVNKILPEDKPRYLMWVWTPENILEAVERWIDMFDCVIPTRNARHWKLFTKNWPINIRWEKFKLDKKPIDEECNCPVCKTYSKAYIRHLFSAWEMLWQILATMHNIAFYQNLMKEIRESIEKNNFLEYKKNFLEKYKN